MHHVDDNTRMLMEIYFAVPFSMYLTYACNFDHYFLDISDNAYIVCRSLNDSESKRCIF